MEAFLCTSNLFTFPWTHFPVVNKTQRKDLYSLRSLVLHEEQLSERFCARWVWMEEDEEFQSSLRFVSAQRIEMWPWKAQAADPSGRIVSSKGPRSLACWNCGFESRRRHSCLLWILCVVRYLRLADPLSKGVLHVACYYVSSKNLMNETDRRTDI